MAGNESAPTVAAGEVVGPSPGVVDEAAIESLLAGLTLDEKALLTAGSDTWRTQAIERLGIPAFKMTDGPNGARGADFTGGVPAACFPAGSALGATWNPALVHEVGAAIGAEARTKSAHVLLAPTVNLHRSPLAGRNFECYSEDPELSARLAVGFITGVQSTGVAACVKHFVGNDSEFERHTMSSNIDERTLRELYLRPFEAAVVDAHTWSVMSAYNAVNGIPANEHRWLLTELLKEEWGFDGYVVSDWFGTYDTVPAATSGLDLEMPGPARHLGVGVVDAVRSGHVSEAQLDDAVRRILRTAQRTGAFESPADAEPERAEDTPELRALARRAAVESMVLLTNPRSVLPLDLTTAPTVAVIGPNARDAKIQGGGSSQVRPHHVSSPLQALTECFGADRIRFAQGCLTHRLLPSIRSADVPDGFRAEWFVGADCDGESVVSTTTKRVSHMWFGGLPAEVGHGRFAVRFTGSFLPRVTGTHDFGVTAAGGARVWIDGDEIIDNWSDPQPGYTFFSNGSAEIRGSVDLTAGHPVELRVEYARGASAEFGAIGLGCLPPQHVDLLGEAVEAAVAADIALVVVGSNPEWETEGSDRVSMDLPGDQDELVRRVAAVNPNTVVVVNSGSATTMPWVDDVAAVLQVWYPGQEYGDALVDVLTGRSDPGGRLPTTFPERYEDNPTIGNYPGENGQVFYAEGLFTGHRHHDRSGVAPRFPFGHGLSYTSFDFAAMTVDAPDGAGNVRVGVEVTNTGARTGSTVVQVYAGPSSGSPLAGELPVRELEGFAKVTLDAGVTENVVVELPVRAFAHWDIESQRWRVDGGTVRLWAGASASELLTEADVEVSSRLLGP